MADNTIDTLDIQVNSTTSRAVRSLEKLSNQFLKLNSALKQVNNGGFRNYAREIGRVSGAIKSLNGLKVNIPDISGLSKQLKNLSEIDSAKLGTTSQAIKNIGEELSGLKGLQTISFPKLDNKSVKSVANAVKSFEKIDSSKISDSVNGVTKIANAVSILNSADFNDSKVISAINAIKRLVETDVEKFNTGKLEQIVTSLSAFSALPDVSSGVNRFLSSLQKLVNAGEKVSTVSGALPNLSNELKNTINAMAKTKDVSDSTNLFVQSIGRLASAGDKTGKTAGQLESLAKETKKFFETMQDAPKISENTIRMTQALAQLASAGGKVNTATNTITKAFNKLSSATNKVTSLVVGAGSKIKGGVTGIVSAFRNIGNSTSGINKATLSLGNLIKMAAGLQIVRKLADFGKSAVTLGSDITEVENVVDVAFGSMADKAYKFASTATEKFGLSELAAKNYSGTMMAMLKSSGVAQKSAAEMSTTLAGLAGDLASFFNIDTDTAFYKLRSGISGEIEPLKQLGINLSIANLQSYALSKGITTSYNSMSQAEKVLLRYNYILSVTGDAQGDFARTSGTWANQVRLLTLNFQSLAAVLGQGIIAGILPAIQALNAFISKLMQAANAFRNFMYVLMGKKLKGSTSGIVNDLAGLEDTSTDLSGLQNAGDDASSGLDNATNSAKALKKALSVLPFDELNQLTDSSDNTGTTSSKKSSSGIGDLSGGLAGLQNSIDDALNTEETPINKWASKIRKAFLKHDWEGIGKTIADMLNIGMQKIYDVINWKKVGPKITQFTDAFTRTFNSLVDNINWNLIGRTLGSGMNTISRAANQLLKGIDWKNLGNKFADGVTGLVREVNWNNFGNMLGNGFMTGWNIFSGFVSNLKYDEIGQAIGNSLNGIFENINFSEIAGALTTGINGAFEALANFTATFNWDDFTNNLGSGISKFIADMDWKENGAALGDFLSHLCKALKDSLTPDTFHDLGVGIGEFLGELPWGELLSTAADLLIGGFANTLGGLFDGLEEKHPISGHIIEGLTAAFIAVKVAEISGIGTLVGKLIGRIGEKIVAEKNAELIASKLSEVLGQGTSGTAEVLEDLGEAAGSSSGKFASLAGELAPFVGAAGLCATLAVGIGEVATKVSSLIDSANGGNGTITDFGYTVDKLISIMQDSNTITADQKDELFLLKEQLEDTNASAGEYGTALADAMAKGKVSSDDLQAAVSQLKVEMNLTEDETEMLTSLLEQMGQKTDEMAAKTSDSATLSKKQWESMKDSLLDLYTQGVIPLDDQLTQLSGTLQSQESAGATAEAAYNKMEKEMKNMGMTNEDISTVLSTLFPEATMAVKTAVDTNIVGAQEKISSSMATAKADVEDATSSMASSADTNAGSIKKNIDDSFKEVSKSSETEWGDSYNSVKEALQDMESGTLSSMKNIMGYIQSYWKSVVLDTNSTWELMSRKADKELSKIKETVKSVSSNISTSLSEFITKIRTSFSEMYTIGHNAAQSLRDGMKSVTMPTLSYYISEWRTHDLGNGKTSSTPIYTPNWFAKGGLFSQASVIGVGESGQEAVLPLTDHKVMKNIADSIMSGYDGNIGLSKEELAAAVERGVVTAMMNNGGFGGSSPEYIMNSIKVNERELARIVTKAQNNTEYRMNPSPAY